MLGDYPTHERLVRDLVVESGAVAVFPDYTPPPVTGSAVSDRDQSGLCRHVGEHGSDIGADSKRLVVVGNSVGGNMVAVVSLMAKDKGSPKTVFQALLWPVTNADFDSASYKEFIRRIFPDPEHDNLVLG